MHNERKYKYARLNYLQGVQFINTNSKQYTDKGSVTVAEFVCFDEGFKLLDDLKKSDSTAKWWISSKFCKNWEAK